MTQSWITLKYGGTSVSSLARWQTIASTLHARIQERHRVCVVVSALSGTTNELEQAIDLARSGKPVDLAALKSKHDSLAESLNVVTEVREETAALFGQLEDWLHGVRLLGEAPPRVTARILAVGELASSRIGAAYLSQQGIASTWLDARTQLKTQHDASRTESRSYLAARVAPVEQRGLFESAVGDASVVVTQGFLAGNAHGETCLLGRGGSDTSAALFAARTASSHLEIWTDVPGMFSADPRLLPTARLIKEIGYREAQELAAMGAKVLHPRCIEPLVEAEIPLSIHSTAHPQVAGTRVAPQRETYPTVHAVTCRQNVPLLTLSTLRMWGRAGFLAEVFEPIRELGLSVDLVGTSQSAVSLTFDPIEGGIDSPQFTELLRRLDALGDVQVVHPCSVVSIVGRDIRAVLHELGPAFEVFQERPIHLVSDSSEDLNLSFVVDEEDGPPLVRRLHQKLFGAQGGDPALGPTWEMIQQTTGDADSASGGDDRWWQRHRAAIVEELAQRDACYLYHLPTVRRQARALFSELPAIDRVFYAMKANPHPAILRTIAAEGVGFETVSVAELKRVEEVLGRGQARLFTPNFCPVSEFETAWELDATVVIDGKHTLDLAPELFRGRSVGVRVDPGQGRGHHRKVRTAGAHAKFGSPLAEIDVLADRMEQLNMRAVGLHAHVGSGILDAKVWSQTVTTLAALRERFDKIEWIDPGGGLGVVEHPAQRPLQLSRVNASLDVLKQSLPGVALYLEPGRYFVSEAGVLVARVNQTRRRSGVNFAGLSTGMNSLMRPALYGAWHGIHNLTRVDEPKRDYWNVVGPICESADVLGRDRWLPQTEAGDLLLLENAGAYGAVMGSHYNLRSPAPEVVLDLE